MNILAVFESVDISCNRSIFKEQVTFEKMQ